MTTPTNWPNPEQPGVPMFPERDGLHSVLFNTPSLGFWMSKDQCWGFNGEEAYSSPDDAAAQFEYIGPVLTPAQIAEMLAAEREQCAKVCDAIATSASNEWKATAYDSDNRAGDAAEETAEICAQKIRNLGSAP